MYLPVDVTAKKEEALFDILVVLLSKEGMIKDPIVDQMFAFLSSKDHIQNALGWLESGKITVGDASLYELKQTHKHQILKGLFRSKDFDLSDKMDMMSVVLGDDKSDLADRCRAACLASVPDAEIKAKTWAEIIDPNSKDSAYVRQAKMSGFYQRESLELIEPYFDKFYEVLPAAYKTMAAKTFQAFFAHMLPRVGDIKDEHIVRLVCLKQDTHDTDKVFANQLQDGIELLVRSKEIRALNNEKQEQ